MDGLVAKIGKGSNTKSVSGIQTFKLGGTDYRVTADKTVQLVVYSDGATDAT